MPGKGRPFPKGVSGNPGGHSGDVQALARQKSPEAIETLSMLTLIPAKSSTSTNQYKDDRNGSFSTWNERQS